METEADNTQTDFKEQVYDYGVNPVGYDYIVALYDEMYREEWGWEKISAVGLSSMIAYHYNDDLSYSYRAGLQAGYSYVDLDNDGLNELIIGGFSREENSVEIYELYTYKNGKAVSIIDAMEAGESSQHYLIKDGEGYKIGIEWYEFDYKGFSYCTLKNKELKTEHVVTIDYIPQDNGAIASYAVSVINGKEVEIDEETANEIMAGYKEKYVLPGFIPFGDEGREPVTNEDVIVRFFEADNFWISWVYGQAYRAYDNPSQIAFGSSRESVTSDSPIQTAAQLRGEMEKHFTTEMADMFFAQLVPEDKDGKLYIYTGDVGGPYSGPKNITVEKINDERYRLNLDIWSYMENEEPDLPDQYVYYVLKNGRWVFENDEQDEYFYSREEPEKYNSEEFEPYNEILKKYYHASRGVLNADRIEKYGLVDIMSGFEEPLKSVGYCLMDVNGDGQNELLIGKVNAGDKIVWDMYSVKNGQAYRVLVSGDRNRHYICESEEGYIIANEIHANATDYSYSYYADLDKSVLKERLWVLNGEWNYMTDYLNVTSQVVDEERANEIAGNYRAKYITPRFISFETLD